MRFISSQSQQPQPHPHGCGEKAETVAVPDLINIRRILVSFRRKSRLFFHREKQKKYKPFTFALSCAMVCTILV
jgi:hypothetical protein